MFDKCRNFSGTLNWKLLALKQVTEFNLPTAVSPGPAPWVLINEAEIGWRSLQIGGLHPDGSPPRHVQ